mgnify:CR=1 FL=1|tara:strand:- start:149 stop:1585 length:1437 start_codon:yes stop_codon:yes gene_type:complete
MADQTTLMGLLKTPSQIRKESQERLMQESLARSQQMLTRGGSTALPGIISTYGAQAAQRGAQAGAGLLRGVAGGVGQAVGGDMGQRISALGIPAEERQAREQQEALRGIDYTNATSLLQAAQRLSEQGMTGAAQALVKRASALRQTEADLAKTQQQTQTEITKQAKNLADMGLTQEQIATEIAKRNPSVDKLTAETAANNALTVKRQAETNRITSLLPGELAQQTATLKQTGVKTDEINSQISLNRERLASLNQTDFLKELSASNLSEEEKTALVNERVQTRARTGGVSGVGNKIIDMRLNSISTIIDTGRSAETGLRVAEQAIQILPNANVGIFSSPLAYANRIAAGLGISDEAQQATVANELIEVLTGRLTLDRASALKGALSDKDLAFLLKSGPRADLNAQTLQTMFVDLYQERYAEQKTAEWFDKKLGSTSDSEIKGMQVEKQRNKRMELYRLEAKMELADKYGTANAQAGNTQ